MFNVQQDVPSVLPVIASKMTSQVAFMVQLSQKMIDGAQQLSTLNLQLAKTMLEEATTNTQQLMTVKNQGDAMSAASNQALPALEKVRAYQQHVQRILSATQADIVKSFENYVPEATRTTQDVVQTISKRASEQTASLVQRQQEAVQQLTSVTKQNMNQAADQAASAIDQQAIVADQSIAAAKQNAARTADAAAKAVTSK